MLFAMNFDIYMKWKLDYSTFVWHIQFFLDSLEIQANQGNIHPTLTMQKVVLTLKYMKEISLTEREIVLLVL